MPVLDTALVFDIMSQVGVDTSAITTDTVDAAIAEIDMDNLIIDAPGTIDFLE